MFEIKIVNYVPAYITGSEILEFEQFFFITYSDVKNLNKF